MIKQLSPQYSHTLSLLLGFEKNKPVKYKPFFLLNLLSDLQEEDQKSQFASIRQELVVIEREIRKAFEKEY